MISDTVAEIAFDHHAPVEMQDPYPLYAELRRECPVAFSSAHGGFYTVARYPDVKRVYSEFQTFSSRDSSGIPAQPIAMYPIDLDPPDHTRLRKIMNPTFEPEAVAALRPQIQEAIDTLIDRFVERGEADLAGELVRPLLATVVLPRLGVPVADRGQIGEWIEAMTRGRATDLAGVQAVQDQIAGYMLALIGRRREGPRQDDLLDVLLQARPQGEAFSDMYIFQTLLIVLFGGLDTTSAVMLEAVLHLVRHPEDAEALVRGDTDWSKAVEEFIRFTAPVQGLRRTTTRPVEIEGVTVPEGAAVLTLNASANRDSEVFEAPDVCRLARSPNEHLAFGSGAHVCIGRHLARVEIELLLKTLLARLFPLRLAEGFTPRYLVGETRGMIVLPVAFAPRPRLRSSAEAMEGAAA